MKRILNCDDYDHPTVCKECTHPLCKRCLDCGKNHDEHFQSNCDTCQNRCPACNGACFKCHLLCDNRSADYHNQARFIK